MQRFNAHVVATEDQDVVAAEVTNQAHDVASFVPSIVAACAELVRSDVSVQSEVVPESVEVRW